MPRFNKVKVTEDNLWDLYEQNKVVFKNWALINNKLDYFSNNCTVEDFIFIFEEAEGIRLFKHFKIECNNTIQKFFTYLTNEQSNLFIIAVFYNYKND